MYRAELAEGGGGGEGGALNGAITACRRSLLGIAAVFSTLSAARSAGSPSGVV